VLHSRQHAADSDHIDQMMQEIQRQFGRQAGEYFASRSHASGESLEAVRRLVGPGPYECGLDVATGAGFTAFAIAERCAQTVALDATPEMLGEARRIAVERGIDRVAFVRGDAERIPLSNASFDLVTCRSSAHHFGRVPIFLLEVARLLRSGGLLVVSDPVSPEDGDLVEFLDRIETLRDPTHVHDLRVSEWKRMIDDAGMCVEDAVLVQTPQVFDAWVHRSGATAEAIAELRPLLADAPGAVADAFHIRREPDGLHFSWDTAVISARKP
jgi:ubiquinone/menaquinone biosynthesis C-methylase UbiE